MKIEPKKKTNKLKTTFSEDILADGKLDVLEIIDSVSFEYKNVSNKIVESQTEYFDLTNMTEMRMMIKTRPRYPTNTLTLSIANITNHKNIRFFNIWLQLNGQYDVDVVLEDSNRKCLNSIDCCFFAFIRA